MMQAKRETAKLKTGNFNWTSLLIFGILLIVICSGAYLRTVGTDWDQGRHLHPDERFLSMVLCGITPVNSIQDYFNTDISTLNPGNQGFGFFVYGTLPIFLIRYVGEWVGQVGYDPITLVGRQLSAFSDVITILLVFFISSRLYNSRIGLAGAAFYAFAVLPIQQSHFMTVDTFTNTFGMLTVYIAIFLFTKKENAAAGKSKRNVLNQAVEIVPYAAFGLALGMAASSKINAISLALLLPLVDLIRYIKTPDLEKSNFLRTSAFNIIIAAILSFLAFRFFQPYAFKGPGFFNLGLNEEWISALKSLRAQSAGEVDFPPALQWARRSVGFLINNLLIWGLGLPLGITSIGSFLAMGWRLIWNKESVHFPIWVWTLFYFVWQCLSWVKAMRYLLLIYPLLAIMAAWGLWQLWNTKLTDQLQWLKEKKKLFRTVSLAIVIFSLVGSAIFAFAFTKIYTRPHTRIAATDWIYENVPGPINLIIKSSDGKFVQQAPYRNGVNLIGSQEYTIPFRSQISGTLMKFIVPSVIDLNASTSPARFSVTIQSAEEPNKPIANSVNSDVLPAESDGTQSHSLEFVFETPLLVQEDQIYLIKLTQSDPELQYFINGVPKLALLDKNGKSVNQLLMKIVESVTPTHDYVMDIGIIKAGELSSIEFPFVLGLSLNQEPKTLWVSLQSQNGDVLQSVSGSYTSQFSELGEGKGTPCTIDFEDSLVVQESQIIRLTIKLVDGEGAFSIASIAPIHESSWDDALPVSKNGYVPYSNGGGIFREDLNLELYWSDDDAKRDRLIETLQQGDYIFISSNRQWGTITRLPERYPLTSKYYRSLVGCPAEMDLVTCYNIAEPGMFSGTLGFDLIKTQTSFPSIGSWSFNDQFAEEAFSVYDHPKVMIFKKSDNFNVEKIREILFSVDLSKVVNLTPKQADTFDENLISQNQLNLTEQELDRQQSGGTWSSLFDREGFQNKFSILAVLLFYLFSMVLGWLIFPALRLSFSGLYDRGYPFARLTGFLLLAVISFVLGSWGLPVTRQLIAIVLIFIAGLGMTFGFLSRREFLEDLKANWKQYLIVELIFLVSFLFFLLIRYHNPDLWHPWKGGEKPMDFSYLNAVIKSTTFPAYDPWFAGGYINYYYYGFVVIGIPIKLLGIIPSVAYNIILPLWYAMLITGAYSVGWNLTRKLSQEKTLNKTEDAPGLFGAPFWAGLSTSALLAFLGNLGTVKLFFQTLKTMGALGQIIENTSVFQQISWIIKGFLMYLQKVPMPLYPGDWYWFPSRVIPGDPITEFPYFTFLYADLHAHLIAMPIAVFAVGWGISVLFSRGEWWQSRKTNLLGAALSILLGGLIIGALKPTNTWDYFTFLLLDCFVLSYVGWKYVSQKCVMDNNSWLKRILVPLSMVALLLFLSSILYKPFNDHFFPGYNQIGVWSGDHTPIGSYLTHWGLMLFLVLFWYSWETYQWLDTTPLSRLSRLKPYRKVLTFAAVIVFLIFVILVYAKIWVALIIIPLCLWSLILIIKADQNDVKRLLFFMIGTGLLETLVVELVYLVGDIGRMNVVFKLYMQAWILMALALGTGFILLWHDQIKWRLRTQLIFQIPVLFLMVGTLLFPLVGTMDKIRDRMVSESPKTLDGMAYMKSARFFDMGVEMNLGEDYAAIQWMQDNIEGSPVILEGQAYEYRWGNRFTIYTGLPGVVGWNYHQRQQRAILRNNVVQERVDQVNLFYQTEDIEFVKDFLSRYKVQYIVLGQLEQAFYPGIGLDKFGLQTGILWDEVFRKGSTVIFKVRSY